MRRLPLLLLIGSTIVSVACGSSSKTGATGDPIPVEGIVDAINTTDCELLVRCHIFSEAAFCPLYFGPTQTGFNSPSAIVAGVASGRVRYDGAAARACIDAIAGAPCSVFAGGAAPAPEACRHVFTGTVADGQPCVGDSECLPGGVCALSVPGGCDGTCTHDGVQCNNDDECTGGKVCDKNLATSTSSGTCAVAAAPGGANQPCGTNDACGSGLTCKTNNDATKTCVPVGHMGDACSGALGSCTDDLTCVFADDGSGAATCLPPAAKGEPCQARGQCGGLLTTMACDPTTHTCVDAPASGPCLGANFACNSLSSYCQVAQGMTPTCTPYEPVGADCGLLSDACGLPGTGLCATADPASGMGTCMSAAGPTACVP